MTPVLCLVTGMAFASDPISMEIYPALDGFAPNVGTIPVAVELRNDGPDARGVLEVSGTQFDMHYPIELPRGSQKRLLTYPTIDYGGARYLLLLDRGRLLKNFEAPPSRGSGTQTVLQIGDSPGDMAFLRTESVTSTGNGDSSQRESNLLKDAYVKPQEAPDRPVGYANLCAVILGAGSERLSDEQVLALKTFSLTGGTLVFVGGASSPILSDPRWQDCLPATGFHAVNLRRSETLENLGGEKVPETSVMSGTPIPGALSRKDGDVLITAERPFGIGKILYLAFNPFELPLSRWDGRSHAVSTAIRVVDSVQSAAVLQNYGNSTLPPGTWAGGSGSVIAGAVPPPSYSSMASIPGSPIQDPFSMTLPSPDRVFTILGAYFLVVIPLNFLVLRKLRRGELAWITAPIISLGFAGFFFASAQDLYSAKMSTAAEGIIVAQEGMPYGIFVGDSKMFIPSSGTYDLKMKGVDSLGIVQTDNAYRGSRQNESNLNPQDTGEITIPEMHANNLAFRQIDYRQRVPVTDWYSIEFQRTGSHKGRCHVRNTGAYPLTNAIVVVGAAQIPIGELRPGDSKTINVDVSKGPNLQTNEFELFGIWSRLHAVALFGYVKDYRPGPQIGKQVENRTTIRVALVAKEALGAP